MIDFAAPDMTLIEAQDWVREHDDPLLYLDGGAQFVLVYKNQPGSVVLEPFPRVTNRARAIELAQKHLETRT
jgi:hypothetical protein